MDKTIVHEGPYAVEQKLGRGVTKTVLGGAKYETAFACVEQLLKRGEKCTLVNQTTKERVEYP